MIQCKKNPLSWYEKCILAHFPSSLHTLFNVHTVDNLIIFICLSKHYIPTIIDWRKSYKNRIMTPCFMWHCSKYLVLNNFLFYMVYIQCIKFVLKCVKWTLPVSKCYGLRPLLTRFIRGSEVFCLCWIFSLISS